MTLEMTTTARGTQTPRLRGANLDRISAATKRSVWGSWTPDADNAPEFELVATEADDLNEGQSWDVGPNLGEDLLDLVPVTEPTVRMATDGQRRYMASLAAERGVELDVTTVEFTQVDAVLAKLKATPRKAHTAPATERVELEDGVYVLDGAIFMVKHAIHGSGRQYASKLDAAPEVGQAGTWVYQGAKPLALLRPEHKLTLALAQQYGAVYGCCVRCGRALTDPESIARSVGSTCWGKF
jgi:hypothetical protein